mgnify:CR=1 FL=1
MIDVSVVIVNYNQFSLLDNCLNSIVKHTQEINYEIIVVDNNSSEGDVSKITSKYQKVKLIQNKTNNRFSLANNQGIELALGKYVLLLNNDTLFIENTILIMKEEIEKYNEPVLIGCKLLNSDYSHQPSVVDFDTIGNLVGEYYFLAKVLPKVRFLNKYFLSLTSEDKQCEVDVVKGAFMFGRKADFINQNMLDVNFFFYNEENDYCFRFKLSGGKVIYSPNTSIIHLGGGSSNEMYGWFVIKNLSLSKIKFFQKHFKGIKFLVAVFIHYSGYLIRVPIYLLGGIFTLKVNLIRKAYYYFRTIFLYPKNIMIN